MPPIGTRHSYDTIEIPVDCQDIRRDGNCTEKGVDWEDTDFEPQYEGNRVVRLLEISESWHLTHISVHRPDPLEGKFS